MTTSQSTRLARFALALLACALVASTLAGCGRISAMLGIGRKAPIGEENPQPAKTSTTQVVDYGALISAADVEKITGVSGVTTMPPGERAGDSPYYVLFTSPTTPQFLSFRAANSGWWEEELKLLKGTETKLTIGGKDAYSYASKDMAESAIVIRMPSTTYVVTTRWLFKTPEGKPQLTDAQLKQVAELVVSRSE